jgi:hypothetical protein
MQATSLPFIVAATAIGQELGLIDAAGSAALIGAGLLSVLCFPLAGLILLRATATRRAGRRAAPDARDVTPGRPAGRGRARQRRHPRLSPPRGHGSRRRPRSRSPSLSLAVG